jgi:hypothetical protein
MMSWQRKLLGADRKSSISCGDARSCVVAAHLRAEIAEKQIVGGIHRQHRGLGQIA